MQRRLVEPLSEREREVLAPVTDGLPNRQIAGKLFVGLFDSRSGSQYAVQDVGCASRTPIVPADPLHRGLPASARLIESD